MIVVTGGGGFIGSVMVGYLNSLGREDIIVIDDLPEPSQFSNLVGKKFTLMNTEEVQNLFSTNPGYIEAVIHMGAISNTLANNWAELYKKNVLATRQWAWFCREMRVPLVFASTAAITGNGTGPLNQYAFSKLVSENEIVADAACLRFFNVYGPNEYHKGRMASTILHWFNQSKDGVIKVFEGSENYRRDFIHVLDVCKACWWMAQPENYRQGVYDLGTGVSRSFEELARFVSGATGARIEYIPMPEDLSKQYQKDTKADIKPLTSIGYDATITHSLEKGVSDYLGYLKDHLYY
jgi:ADP-L-glycero-D-manno-heptose 6-epimerase